METKAEHDFIRQSQKVLKDAGDYFIAGSRFPEPKHLLTETRYFYPQDLEAYGPMNYTGSIENKLRLTFDPSYSIHQSGNVSKIKIILGI